MNYYVYVYLDTRKPGDYIYDELKFNYEPIYVGKGKKRRCKNHLSLRNSMENHFYNKLNKIINDGFVPEIVIIRDDMIEEDAFNYEIEIIKKIGKIVDNTGTLTNLTNGGEGSSGRICSDDTKLKISKMNKGEKNGMFNKLPVIKGKSYDDFFGAEKSKEIKIKIKENANPFWKDKNLTEEMKNKISKTLKNRFENKELHPMYGKIMSTSSKKKISETLINYFKENPKIVSEDTKEKQSISAKERLSLIKIKNIETSEILEFKGVSELKNFIKTFKIQNGIGKTNPPSYNLLINNKNEKYFILIEKIKR